MQAAQQITGIPIEWLLTIIAALIGCIYASLLYEVRAIRKSGDKRDAKVTALHFNVRTICQKLEIPFFSNSDDKD